MKYIRKNTIEYREYQVRLAEQAFKENCIVVLPTGLGKTAIAAQVIAAYMEGDRPAAVLFLAPTRVLAGQHHDFLQSVLTIDDIALVTGEDAARRRSNLWNASVICATPEITRNDLTRGMITPDMFGLVVFDEVHRAVGDYAYSGIAQRMEESRPLILGMTATLPSDRDKATEIIARLRTTSVAERSEASPDVSPYIQKTETEVVIVDLTPKLLEIQSLLRRALNARCRMLRQNRIDTPDNPSLSSLLQLRSHVLEHNRGSATPLFTAIRIHYALSMLEAQGIEPFLKFCKRARAKRGAGIRELFEADPNFTRALALAEEARRDGIEHPKLAKMVELLAEIRGKILVFASYRDSVDMICSVLDRLGMPSGKLIGKAGQAGLKQRQQIETVRRFRDGEFSIMVATRVGEEGLDIAEVNHVIFYDNVPSSIRYVQRRGRTGRKTAGRLIVLTAKGTVDEAYYWTGRRKIRTARSMGRVMSNELGADKSNEADADGTGSKQGTGQSVAKTGLDAFI